MSTTVRQVMKYLSEYPDKAKLGVMVADTKNRKKYQIKDGNWLDMFSYPVLVLDVGEAHDMDEVEKQVACECEEPEILELTKDLVYYKCKNCGEDICAIKRGNYKERLCNYCPKCGQRFNWEEVELDEA